MFREFAVIFIGFSFIFNLSAQDLQLYPVETGTISYKYEGRTSGNEIIYFDNYGKLYYSLKTVYSNETTPGDSMLTILKHDTLYKIDIVEQTVLINLNSNKHNIISNEILSTLGYVVSGTETIAGKTCIKFSGENGTIWVWNNIVLKSETEIMNTNLTKEATEIFVGINVPPSRFEIPEKYNIITKY